MKKVEQSHELKAAVAGKKAIVLVHSSWCPFCRSFRPVFEEATAGEPYERIEAVLDEDENPLWNELAVDIVPTVLFYEDGKIVRRLDGRPGVGLRRADLVGALGKAA